MTRIPPLLRALLHILPLLAALIPLVPVCAAAGKLTVEAEHFVLTLDNGRTLTSRDLVGAELTTLDGQTFRIDSVEPSKERPGILLHHFSLFDPATGNWTPACEADFYGRRAGFPVAGRWDARGRYLKDGAAWFLTCTSGSQGKCVLWGYDPWMAGPHGEDLTAYYQACQYTVRANYDGSGAHTRNGTPIDVSDDLGIQTPDGDPARSYLFEAGWGTAGAVCVARTRWPDLLTREALMRASPHLRGRCDQVAAQRRGAIIFTRIVDKTAPPPASASTQF